MTEPELPEKVSTMVTVEVGFSLVPPVMATDDTVYLVRVGYHRVVGKRTCHCRLHAVNGTHDVAPIWSVSPAVSSDVASMVTTSSRLPEVAVAVPPKFINSQEPE